MYKEFLIIFDREFLFDFELVCSSLNLSYKIKHINSYYLVLVAKADYEKIYKNFNDFIKETLLESNKDIETHNIPILDEKPSLFSYSIIIFMILFYFYYALTDKKYLFFELGANNAYLVVNGEFYRCITALTLHANFLHLLSNMTFFVIIYRYVIKIFGEGIGWFLILFSGFFGNLLTSFFYQQFHSSIGFSTSIFGVVGILSCVNIKIVKNFLPVVAGFFLFIMLGGGKNVDIIAHISGFISGIILTEIFLKKYKFLIKHKNQNLFKLIVIFAIIFSWWLAFHLNHI